MTATGAKTYYLGRDDQAHTCTFAIGSRRYTYHLTPLNLDSVEHLCRKVSILKGLNLAKRRDLAKQKTMAGT